MSEARTKLDLLYQEALGDIDALLTRIENMDHGVTEAIGALDKAGEVFRTDVIHLQAAAKSELLDYQERIQAIGANKLHQEVNELTKAFLGRIETEMKDSIRKEIARPVRDAVEDLSGYRWKLPLYCLLAGGIGAGTALLAYEHFAFDKSLMAAGTALSQTWTKLPKASQKLIEDAANK